MATLIQRARIVRERKKDNARTRILKKNPQARGLVNRVTIVTPRKPNSAKRPVVKLYMKKIRRLTAHIPGIGHTLKKFSKMLIRGRGPRDLPGVRYSGVRGVLDFMGLKKKKRRRSIYGAPQNVISKISARRRYRLTIRKAENERIQKLSEDKILPQNAILNKNMVAIFKKQSFRSIIKNSTVKYNFPFFWDFNFKLNVKKKNILSKKKYSKRKQRVMFYLSIADKFSFFKFAHISLFFCFFRFFKNFKFYKNKTVFFFYNFQKVFKFFLIENINVKINYVSFFLKKSFFDKYFFFFFKIKIFFFLVPKEFYFSQSWTEFVPVKKQINIINRKKKSYFLLKEQEEAKKTVKSIKRCSRKIAMRFFFKKSSVSRYYFYNKRFFLKKLISAHKFIYTMDSDYATYFFKNKSKDFAENNMYKIFFFKYNNFKYGKNYKYIFFKKNLQKIKIKKIKQEIFLKEKKFFVKKLRFL